MRAISRVITLVALLVASSAASGQQAFLDHGVRLSITSRSSDSSQKVTVSWGAATDGRLSADTFYVWLRIGSHSAIERRLIVQSTTITIPLPADTRDSVVLRATVRASRRGVVGTDSVYGSRWFKRAPLVLVPSKPDSMKIRSLTGGPLPAEIGERDTLIVVARRYFSPGKTRLANDTTTWDQVPSTTDAVLSFVPFPGGGFHSDTVRIIALDCRCRETGDPTLRFDFGKGEWTVRRNGVRRSATM
jgi:hypothetical protein